MSEYPSNHLLPSALATFKGDGSLELAPLSSQTTCSPRDPFFRLQMKENGGKCTENTLQLKGKRRKVTTEREGGMNCGEGKMKESARSKCEGKMRGT
jgi:hypothetical protein